MTGNHEQSPPVRGNPCAVKGGDDTSFMVTHLTNRCLQKARGFFDVSRQSCERGIKGTGPIDLHRHVQSGIGRHGRKGGEVAGA